MNVIRTIRQLPSAQRFLFKHAVVISYEARKAKNLRLHSTFVNQVLSILGRTTITVSISGKSKPRRAGGSKLADTHLCFTPLSTKSYATRVSGLAAD